MKTLYWAWLVSLLMTLSATAAPAYRGMSYTPWSENVLFTAGSSQSIANMQAVGVDTVALNVFAFQDDETFDGHLAGFQPVQRQLAVVIAMRSTKSMTVACKCC